MIQSGIDTSTATKTCNNGQKRFNLTSPPMLSFWMGCLCILAGYLLLTGIERHNYILRTVSVGTLALLALSLHLLTRNVLRDPFHPDILLTVGHLAQFVIPGLIFGTGFFDDILFSHTSQVRSFFPEMLLGVLIAQTIFNLPFCLMPRRGYDLRRKTEKGLPFFIAALLVGVWLSRCALLATGSYFHFGSKFVNTSTLYSPLAVISTLGRIVLAYVLIRMFEAKSIRRKILPMIYLLLEISWHLFSGKRQGLLIAILCIILVYIFVRKRLPLFYSLLFLFALVVGSVFINSYRAEMRAQASQKEVSIINASRKAWEMREQFNVRNSMNLILDRLNDGQFAAGCFKSVPNPIGFLHGQSYKMILWIPIPRVLYPSRPQFRVEYNTVVARPQIAGTSCPTTTVGEAYINFGWFGIPLVFFLLGLVYRCMESIFKSRPSSSEAAILLFFCVMTVTMSVNPAVSHLSWMLKVLVLLFLCRIIESKFWRTKENIKND
jgi:oligosaccharide repeat unit polymerase